MPKKKYISQEYSASGQGKNLQEGTPKTRAATIFAASFFSFAIFMAIGLVTFTIVFFFSKVDGSSMMITLNANYATDGNTDAVIVNRHKKPQKGDIVVLKPYENKDDYYIKRVIATAGDRVYFHINNDNTFTILVNDVELDEWYLDKDFWGQNNINPDYRIIFNAMGNGVSESTKTYARSQMTSSSYPRFSNWIPEFEHYNTQYNRNEILIPPGYFFYVGDNRGADASNYNSQEYSLMSKDDGMYRGPQPTWKIVGTVVDIMNHRSAPKWVWEKIVWFVTFKWAR